MKKSIYAIACLIFSVTLNAQELSDNDKDFLKKAGSGGLMEVKLGEMAQRQASSADVKELGSMMVKDHSKANAELKQLAKEKNFILPDKPESEQQDHIDDLSDEKGADFDKKYAALMVKDHKEDITLFKKAADKCDDPAIKKWASGKVTTLEHHLSMAEKAHKKLK